MQNERRETPAEEIWTEVPVAGDVSLPDAAPMPADVTARLADDFL